MSRQRVALLGMGEAGSHIATDLVAAGVAVTAYDPRPVVAPAGVVMLGSEAEAAAAADVVLSVNWASVAVAAASAALPGLTPRTLYAELNTASPAQKRAVAAAISPSGACFVDVALMSNVPGKGVRTPMLVAGPGAEEFAALVRGFGTEVEVLAGETGEAAGRKLLRSVFMKGFGSVVVEALAAARAAGLEQWMETQIQAVLADPGEARRFDAGTRLHARRRSHEMAAALELLADLGTETTMTRATLENLRLLAGERARDERSLKATTRTPARSAADEKEKAMGRDDE